MNKAPAKPATQQLTAEAPSRTAESLRKHLVSSAHSALAPRLRGEKCFAAAKNLRVCSADHSAPFIHPFIRVLKIRHRIYGIVNQGADLASAVFLASLEAGEMSRESPNVPAMAIPVVVSKMNYCGHCR